MVHVFIFTTGILLFQTLIDIFIKLFFTRGDGAF